jgi:hypothetical protein
MVQEALLCSRSERNQRVDFARAHDSTYSIHLESTKIYHDLKSRYWWYGMKRGVAEYVALCDNC